jgi:hypothetical protein
MDPSSGETYVFMQHLVLVSLCGWQSGRQGGKNEKKVMVPFTIRQRTQTNTDACHYILQHTT